MKTVHRRNVKAKKVIQPAKSCTNNVYGDISSDHYSHNKFDILATLSSDDESSVVCDSSDEEVGDEVDHECCEGQDVNLECCRGRVEERHSLLSDHHHDSDHLSSSGDDVCDIPKLRSPDNITTTLSLSTVTSCRDDPISTPSVPTSASMLTLPRSMSPPPSCLPAHTPPPTNTRQAGFVLNTIRQIENIAADATLGNYKHVINDAGKNITIQCNSGFYLNVAQPLFCNLVEGSVLKISDQSIICYSIIIDTENQSAEHRRIVKFKHECFSNSFHVTVVLHHTVRKLQVQGSTIIEGTTSPLWFYNSFLKGAFQSGGHLRETDIINTNRSLQNVQVDYAYVQKCSACNGDFNNRCKPTQCNKCSLSFHKTRCLRSHPCNIPTVTPDLSSQSGSTSVRHLSGDQPRVPQRSALLSQPDMNQSITDPLSSSLVNPSSSHGQQVSVQGPVISQSVSIQGTSPVMTLAQSRTTETVVTNSLYPVICQSVSPAIHPFSFSSQTQDGAGIIPNNSNTRPPKNNSKKGSQLPSDLSSVESELIKRELSLAKAKIVQQDTLIKDQVFKIEILEGRLKSFEHNENQRLHKEYFPSSQSEDKSQSVSHSQPNMSPHCSNVCCCHVRQSHTCCPLSVPQLQSVSQSNLQNILTQLNELKSEIKIIKSQLPNNSTIPVVCPAQSDNECHPLSPEIMVINQSFSNASDCVEVSGCHSQQSCDQESQHVVINSNSPIAELSQPNLSLTHPVTTQSHLN